MYCRLFPNCFQEIDGNKLYEGDFVLRKEVVVSLKWGFSNDLFYLTKKKPLTIKNRLNDQLKLGE